MKYIKGLDVMRAFAVLLVIGGHWGPHRVKSEWLTFIFTDLFPPGTFGVDLFFVLSGYLITRILLEARNDSLPGERRKIIKAFYFRRALRIFPVYFLLIFIVACLANDGFVKTHIWYFLTYTSNFLFFATNSHGSLAHTWSLAIEEQFYLIWPWIIIYTPKKYLVGLILLFAGTGIVSTVVFCSLYGTISNALLPPCFIAFSIGALYAYVRVYPGYEKQLVWTIMVLLPLSIFLLFFNQLIHGLILIRAIDSVIGISLIIYITREKYNAVTSFIFNNNILAFIGKISYGIYLLHFILPKYYFRFILYLQQKQWIGRGLYNTLHYIPLAYFINFVLLLAISYLSYRFIETPFLNLKRHFTYTGTKTTNAKVSMSNYA